MTFSTSRSLLDKELNDVRTNILRMASLVDTAVGDAMLALHQRNLQLAQQVIAGDDEINRLRYTIEEECLTTLATQAPAARDLRTVIAAIHIAVELERMGDHAAGIARLVARLEGESEIESLYKLPKMEKQARKMLQTSIDAYVNNNPAEARDLVRRDDKLDKQYRKLYQESVLAMQDSDYIRRAMYLLWVGHNLERIGDRCTNIAERVIFMSTGEFVETVEDAIPEKVEKSEDTAVAEVDNPQ
ncbi:MAG TPA: phosphate signaling complex protein PhoU [Chloroflexota bacterium]|nr:phosphate signaling complex protein PhoU [Chloroflexota bacterium]HUM69278.1 phosphate signaling complex protein PhoU [Chloroflexota bacterium]